MATADAKATGKARTATTSKKNRKTTNATDDGKTAAAAVPSMRRTRAGRGSGSTIELTTEEEEEEDVHDDHEYDDNDVFDKDDELEHPDESHNHLEQNDPHFPLSDDDDEDDQANEHEEANDFFHATDEHRDGQNRHSLDNDSVTNEFTDAAQRFVDVEGDDDFQLPAMQSSGLGNAENAHPENDVDHENEYHDHYNPSLEHAVHHNEHVDNDDDDDDDGDDIVVTMQDGKILCGCGGTHLPLQNPRGFQSWRSHVMTKRHQKWMEDNGILGAV